MLSFDVNRIRKDFPTLKVKVHGKPLVYLDNAATTLKPQCVIDRLTKFYTEQNSNVHRGVHHLSELATAEYEGSREKVRKFINASKTSEVIFTRGTTEGINLVMSSFGRTFLKGGDEIIISGMEHHSNIVPWQILCQEKNCQLKILPIDENGELCLKKLSSLITDQTKLISIVYISNSLGTINPIKEIIQTAHHNDIPVIIDAAQAVNHLKVDVQDLDCDFLAFSGHKLLGPTGIGILYGKAEFLNRMPPYQAGGDMISSVTFEKTTYNVLPYKFEAGTPNIAGAIGLGTAIDYIESVGLNEIALYEKELLRYATEKLLEIPGLRIIGTAKNKTAIVSFVLPNIHPHDLGTLVDEEGIAIRTGHHCTQPVMQFFKIPATSRASFSFYNTKEEVDKLYEAIIKAKSIFPD